MAVLVHRLSKSRFLAGLQCLKRLWWEAHEPEESPLELALQNRFRWGDLVNARARAAFGPGPVIERDIERDPQALAHAVAATERALAARPRRLYEAAFEADGLFVAVDVLERVPGGWRLVEVKSSTRVKPEHVADLAVQAWVLARAGVRVQRAEVAHLNPECTYPELDDLLVREDVTDAVRAFLVTVPDRLKEQRETLAGDLPERAVGRHCDDPRPCPFRERCWSALPPHHLRTLYVGREPLLRRLEERGAATIADIPDDVGLSPIQERQRRAVRTGAAVVEPGLAEALAAFPGPIAFLDFETVAPAIPVWDGCSPYTQVPVQFACVVRGPRSIVPPPFPQGGSPGAFPPSGAPRGLHSPPSVPPRGTPRAAALGAGADVTFHEHLAEEGADPRRALAERLLAATRGARTVFAYYARFETACVQHLAFAFPDLRAPLLDLVARIRDLLPIVREHVYDPAFEGSFSLKRVLPALLPDLGYRDLEIQEGLEAAARLERMLVLGPAPTGEERERLRADLFAYCRRDVEGLAALYDWLAARG